MNKLIELINKISGKHVYIQTHNFPDPDALGSGFGLRYLLSIHGISATLCAKGEIDRFNTEKMIEMFNIPISFCDREFSNINDQSEIILIDSQYGNGNVKIEKGKVIGCIDHHHKMDNYIYEFSDIQEDIGACSSIVAQYFFDNNIEIPSEIAEALLYGIKVDTLSLTRCVNRLDMEMFYYLYGKCNRNIISYIDKNTMKLKDLNAYENAIKTMRMKEKISFAYIGYNCSDALVAVISDFLLDIAEISFAVAYSIKEDGIKISVRSDGEYENAGLITMTALENIGTGGGHSAMAGGFIPYSDQVNIMIRENRFMEFLEEKFLDVISKKASNRN